MTVAPVPDVSSQTRSYSPVSGLCLKTEYKRSLCSILKLICHQPNSNPSPLHREIASRPMKTDWWREKLSGGDGWTGLWEITTETPNGRIFIFAFHALGLQCQLFWETGMPRSLYWLKSRDKWFARIIVEHYFIFYLIKFLHHSNTNLGVKWA